MALAAAAAAAIDPGEVMKDGRNFFKSENEDDDLALLLFAWPRCALYPDFLKSETADAGLLWLAALSCSSCAFAAPDLGPLADSSDVGEAAAEPAATDGSTLLW